MEFVYTWMARPRLRGYRKTGVRDINTEFDRWMRAVDMNVREASMALDMPTQRITDLRCGWRDGRINGGIVPSIVTRYAMTAVHAELRPAAITADCMTMRERLAQAAHDEGLEPWPAGELFRVNPYALRPARAIAPRVPKKPRPKAQWSPRGKRILTASES